MNHSEKFVMIDVETDGGNLVCTIGAVIVNSKTWIIEELHYYTIEGTEHLCWYGNAINLGQFAEFLQEFEQITFTKNICAYDEAIQGLRKTINTHHITQIFAYNASFDCRMLPEFSDFIWCDVIHKAAYEQYNPLLPKNTEFYGSGKMKRGYSVESMYRLVCPKHKGYLPSWKRKFGQLGSKYFETHNGLIDAVDQVRIMQAIGYTSELYGDFRNKKSSQPKRTDKPNENIKRNPLVKRNDEIAPPIILSQGKERQKDRQDNSRFNMESNNFQFSGLRCEKCGRWRGKDGRCFWCEPMRAVPLVL